MSDFNYIKSKSVPNGTKFVAFYEDGSGAMLFTLDDVGDLYDERLDYVNNATDTYLIHEGFSYWMEIPETFKLFGERL